MEVQITKKRLEDIGRFYDLIKSPSGIVEAFFIKPDGAKATRFLESRDKFVSEVMTFNSQGFTCYAGIQPRNPALLSENRASTDEDIVGLHLLYMDQDPVRSEERKCNATDREKERCLDATMSISEKVSNGMGYQAPMITSSGNGNWLFLRIPEVPITDANRKEMGDRLKAWGRKGIGMFQTEGVKSDSAVFDLRRIAKIPGTKIFNCPDEEDRPQRVAEILTDGLPEIDEKLGDHFLQIPVEASGLSEEGRSGNRALNGLKPERIFERCHALRFLKAKGESGVNHPHAVRLALSSISLAVGDLENNLHFIRQIIGNCPDFSEAKTRYYLERNRDKSAPYGCAAWRKIISEHFSDFDPDQCACNLPPSFDRATGSMRKSSPVRFARLMEEDLEELFKELELGEDPFKNFLELRNFTKDILANFDAQTAKIFLESQKNDLKLKANDIKNLLAYRAQVIQLAKEDKSPSVELSEEEEAKAVEILKRPSLLFEYIGLVNELGVVGEKKNIGVVLLTLTSRLLPELISLVIKAESSSGKSHLLKSCLQLFPEESFMEFTSVSNKAMIYTERDFSHKFIVFYEYSAQENNEEMDYLVRTLQSEGRLKYEYTAKDKDGQFTTISIDKEGPTGFITTTTKAALFDENETRIFSIFIDESAEQTRMILQMTGESFGNWSGNAQPDNIDSWKNIQRALKPYPVIIPYARWLSDHVPAEKVRVRRDFKRVLMTISVCALLHQYQREIVREDGAEDLVASIADYHMVRELLGDSLMDTVDGMSPKTELLVRTVQELYEELETTKEDEEKLVPITKIINTGIGSRRSVYNWMEPALSNGYIEKVTVGRRVFYKPTGKAIGAGDSFLPPTEKLINAFPKLAGGLQLIHPITGSLLRVEDDGK